MLPATFSPGYSMVALAQCCIRQKDCVHEGENVTISGVQMNCTSPGSGKWGLSRYRSERHSWGSHIYLQKWTEPGHAHLCIWGAGTPWACQICCTYTVQPASTCLGNSKYSENVIKGEGELKQFLVFPRWPTAWVTLTPRSCNASTGQTTRTGCLLLHFGPGVYAKLYMHRDHRQLLVIQKYQANNKAFLTILNF